MTARAASSASRPAIIAAHLYMRGTATKTYIAVKFFIRAWALARVAISFSLARCDHILLRKRSVSMNPPMLNVTYLRLDWRNDDHTALGRSHGPPRAPRGELEQTKNWRHRLATCGAN